MRVHKKIGTKDRLFEMFENVNKIKLNESFNNNNYFWSDVISRVIELNNKSGNKVNLEDGWGSGGYESKSTYDDLDQYIDSVANNFISDTPNDNEIVNILSGFQEWQDTHDEPMGESFDNPIAKDEKYLDKTVGDESSQVSKYDDGTRYPVEDKLKTKDPSLEKLKGDDAPIVEGEDDQDIADENSEESEELQFDGNPNEEPEDNDGGAEEKPAWDEDFGGEEEPEETEVEEPEMAIDDIPAGDGEEAPELDDKIEGDGVEQMANTMEEPHEDQIEGGLADNASPTDFCPVQIAKGIQIEMEHTDDPHKALEIAMDHLTEIPDYYDRLEAMEAEAKGEGMESDEGAPEDSLLDPSQHWVDDYSPQNVSMGDDIDEAYPLEGGDPEAGEEEYEFSEKAKNGEFNDLDAEEDEDWNKRIKSGQMKPIN